jgi:hypothetical protein
MVAGRDGSPPWSPSTPFVLSDANAAALMVVGQGLGCPLRSYWRVSCVYTHVDVGAFIRMLMLAGPLALQPSPNLPF